MSRTTAPLLSFSASGQIAKTQVYAEWKGRPYVRRYVVPANPQSTEQTVTRSLFAWLNETWKYLPAGATGAWDAYATNNRFTNRNGWIKQNLSPMRGDTDLANMIGSPSVNGGIIPAGIALTPGANEIQCVLTAPSLPTGWTITAAHMLAIPSQDPQTDTDYQSFYATDAAAPYDQTITGLTTAQLYRVFGWFEYAVTATKTAWGLAISDTDTPT